MKVTPPHPPSETDLLDRGLMNERLTLEAFVQLSGRLAGYSFVKVAVDLGGGADRLDMNRGPATTVPQVHFINHSKYRFHSDYLAENILKMSILEMDRNIDDFNRSVYLNPKRRFCMGTLALHTQGVERFFSLETVELDTMDGALVRVFFDAVKKYLDPGLPLLFKPANHLQEKIVGTLDPAALPRVFSHQIFSTAQFLALNLGETRGRIRAFETEDAYRKAQDTIEWYDLLVMHRVPDDIPRVSGMINAQHTTPLSHTNVLASGWKIPNAIQLGIFEKIEKESLDLQWVSFRVEMNATEVSLTVLEHAVDITQPPAWSLQRIKLEEPETLETPIFALETLRASDRFRYGTKAANLGELGQILVHGSERLLSFYTCKRPSQPHLLAPLAKYLKLEGDFSGTVSPRSLRRLSKAAEEFLQSSVKIPRGIAIPFSIQQQFLQSSPRIQQAIGKLKMALELEAREIDSICLNVQSLIRNTRYPLIIRDYIQSQIDVYLSGVEKFVIRSSSNAEDLEGFSAAGIYESINHVIFAEKIFDSIKEVWASLLSPRSVRFRQEVGISLDDCYMGVIVQEEVSAELGGVLVTTNPLNRSTDFRNVYLNASRSVTQLVQGESSPYQYLYNTVEGGGRTLSLGDAPSDLPESTREQLQKLAFAGRFLQSHFSPDVPVDIEWVISPKGLFVLQLRPYSAS